MRVKDGKVELRLTIDPETYAKIIEYLDTTDDREISKFIEEVVVSYVEMHTQLFEEERMEN